MKIRTLVGLAVFPCLALAAESVVEVPISGISSSALLVNSKARKLYVGGGHMNGEWGLWVYGIQADGSTTATDERVYPEPLDRRLNSNYDFPAVTSLVLSPRLA